MGLIIGTLSMSIFGTAFNAVYLLPKFSELFHLPLENIIQMGADIHSAITGVGSFVFLCVAPLNIVKGAMVSLLTMLLYKHVAAPLFKIKEPEASDKKPEAFNNKYLFHYVISLIIPLVGFILGAIMLSKEDPEQRNCGKVCSILSILSVFVCLIVVYFI